MKIIVTKYATTSGVQIREGEIADPSTMFECRDKGTGAYAEYFHGNDWHQNGVKAHNDVVARFMRKRTSLKQQLAKLDDKLANALTAIKESGL